MNLVIVEGNLARDPIIRTTKTGKAVASFTLGVTEEYIDSKGERKKTTNWPDVVAWGKYAEAVANYCHKGTRVHVMGKYTTRSYDDPKTNQRKWVAEITANSVSIDAAGLNAANQQTNQQTNRQTYQQTNQQNFGQFGEAHTEQPAQNTMFPAGNNAPYPGEEIPF